MEFCIYEIVAAMPKNVKASVLSTSYASLTHLRVYIYIYLNIYQ